MSSSTPFPPPLVIGGGLCNGEHNRTDEDDGVPQVQFDQLRLYPLAFSQHRMHVEHSRQYSTHLGKYIILE